MREFGDKCLPQYNEIPGVGLFLEQVSKYISEYLNLLGVPELTGSMISNYVKKKILDNPVKKQYGREQIAYLIFIAIAKTVLSLEDINMMIGMQKDVCSVERAYDYFRTEFIKMLSLVASGNGQVPAIDMSGADEEKIRSKELLQNIMITAAHKIYLDLTFEELRTKDNVQADNEAE